MRPRGFRLGVFAAAATYVGTVVGAGFASGQEVLQFFGLLGPSGPLAILLAVAGFLVFGFAVMEIGRRLKADSHLPVMREASGRYISPILDFVTTFFLFGAFSAMLAGAGSALAQEFQVSWLVGTGLMALLSLVTVLLGLRGIVTAVSAIVPLLIVGVMAVSIGVLRLKGLTLATPPTGWAPLVGSWPLSGITYVSYNLIMASPILAALGTTLNDRREVFASALMGSFGLGLALLLVYLAIVSSFPEVLVHEVPLARLASEIHHLGGRLYALVFLAEVYTTAVANLYGFVARLSSPGTPGFAGLAVATVLVSAWASSAGFSNLVKTIYPLVGWTGSLFLVTLMWYVARRL
ncbi:MAG: hypothetical protein ACOX3V_06030 [Bacillota bacterium]|jgi:uncharacterized membrane protein YkvI